MKKLSKASSKFISIVLTIAFIFTMLPVQEFKVEAADDSNLIAYEGFDVAEGTTLPEVVVNVDTLGTGWAPDSRWTTGNTNTDNGLQPFEFAVDNKMVYNIGSDGKYLQTSPGYLTVGRRYTRVARVFDVNASAVSDLVFDTTFKESDTVEKDVKAFGKPGTTLWFSAVMAPINKFPDEPRYIVFNRGQNGDLTSYKYDKIAIGYWRKSGTKWQIGRAYNDGGSMKEELTNTELSYSRENMFLVFKMEYNTDGTSTFSLFVNPDLDADLDTTTPDAKVENVEGNYSFDRISIAGMMPNLIAFDELRLGRTAESVVPTTSEERVAPEHTPIPENTEDILFVEEDFDYPNGKLIVNENVDKGLGWKQNTKAAGETPDVQSRWRSPQDNEDVANKALVTDEDPLTYPNLKSSASRFFHDVEAYDKPDDAFKSFGRSMEFNLDRVDEKAKDYFSPDGGYYGSSGKVMWASALIRPEDTNASGNGISFHYDRWGFPYQVENPAIVVGKTRWGAGNNNNWNLVVNDEAIDTGIEIEPGKSYFMVLKIESYSYYDGKVSLYINPDVTQIPTTPTAEIYQRVPILIRGATMLAKSTNYDAIRMGSTYRAIAPLSNYRLPVNKVRVYPENDDFDALTGAKVVGTSVGETDQLVELATIQGSEDRSKGYIELTFENDVAYKYVELLQESSVKAEKVEFICNDALLQGEEISGVANNNAYVGLNLGGNDQAATPEFAPVETEILSDIDVEVEIATTEGADVYYTTDGSEPSEENGELYDPSQKPVVEPGSEVTFKAIAVKEGLDNSYIASKTYKVTPYELGPSSLVDFEEAEQTDTDVMGNPYINEYGYRITNILSGEPTEEMQLRIDGGNKRIYTIGWGETFIIDHIDGKKFNLDSFDYSGDPWGGYSSAKLTGYKTDGTILEDWIVTTGEDLKTKDLAWENLLKVEINYGEDVPEDMVPDGATVQKSAYGGLDNLVFRGEPANAPTIVTDEVTDADAPIEVEITTDEEEGVIYYTLDGTDPTTESLVYSDKIAIGYGENVTVKAAVWAPGKELSEVVSKTYSVKAKLATPIISPENVADADAPVSVTITTDVEGAKIYYTLDGSEPTASSTEYTEAISIGFGESKTVKAIAVKDGMVTSDVAEASYSVKAKLAEVTFSKEAGSFEVDAGEKFELTLSAEEGAIIYYTLDGSDPTTSSTKFEGAIQLGAGETTVKAIAVKDGAVSSDVASASYTITEKQVEKKKPTVAFKTSVITNKTKTIKGTATVGSKVTVTVGKKKYNVTAKKKNWSVKISKPKVSNKVKIVAELDGVKSKVKSKNVIPSAPTVKKVTKKSKKITGKVPFKNVKVTVKVGKKTYRVKAKKKKYTVKVKKLKKGTKITVSYVYKKKTSVKKTIKVK